MKLRASVGREKDPKHELAASLAFLLCSNTSRLKGSRICGWPSVSWPDFMTLEHKHYDKKIVII